MTYLAFGNWIPQFSISSQICRQSPKLFPGSRQSRSYSLETDLAIDDWIQKFSFRSQSQVSRQLPRCISVFTVRLVASREIIHNNYQKLEWLQISWLLETGDCGNWLATEQRIFHFLDKKIFRGFLVKFWHIWSQKFRKSIILQENHFLKPSFEFFFWNNQAKVEEILKMLSR